MDAGESTTSRVAASGMSIAELDGGGVRDEDGGLQPRVVCSSTPEVLTNLSFRKRKRGKEGPASCLTPSTKSAITAAIESSPDRVGEPVFFPYVGTRFNSYKEAKDFYNTYSWEIGFGIRDSRSKKNRNEYVTRKDIVCSCEGFCLNPNAASARSGCRARIALRRTEDHAWVISSVIAEHNHPLSVGCGEKTQWTSHSFVDPMTRTFIERLRRNNVPLGRVCSIVGAVTADSEMPLRKQAIKNVCARLAEEDVKDDMQKTLELLKKMQGEDSGFDVRFRTDEEGVIESMIWCTGRNKRDFEKYGDVVTFDTTYRTNLYNLPFGIFVGVNSHYQSIIFGGVLLRHERTEDFEWTFSNFRDMMGGKMPKTIPTDQCQAMAAAIKTIWKGCRHRWCRWHVLRVAKQKIGPQYSKKSTFKKKFNRLITHEVSPSAFEEQWANLVEEYKLADNKFVARAYQMRGMWAKPYFMDIFCAGMTSTQRSESANHMLKRFIQRGAPMHIFVSKFSDLQFERNQEEEKENFKTKILSRRRRLGLPIETHAEKIYTREMHERFYTELFESGAFKIIEKSANEKSFVLVHHNELDKEDPRKYKVQMQGAEKVTCTCGLYEHVGLPCRHSLKVLVHLDITEIPIGNINNRWTRAYSKSAEDAEKSTAGDRVVAQANELKRRILILKALELSQTKEDIDEEDFTEAVRAMDIVVSRIQNKNQSRQVDEVENSSVVGQIASTLPISCPPRVKRTGRPRNSSLKSWNKSSKLEKENIRCTNDDILPSTSQSSQTSNCKN